MNDYTIHYEVIDQDKKVVAIEFSKLGTDIQEELLRNINPRIVLSDIEMRWDLDTGYTILNKENWMYPVMIQLVPVLMELSDVELDEEEKSFHRGFETDSLRSAVKYIFTDERKRRRIFEEKEHRKQEIQNTIDIIKLQPISSQKNISVFRELEQQRFCNSPLLMYSAVFNYGFIQGKRAERLKRGRTISTEKYMIKSVVVV